MCETGDVPEVRRLLIGVVAPVQPCRRQRGRERRQPVGRLRLKRAVGTRVVDDRGLGRDQHQVVRFRLGGHFCEVIVAQRVLLGVGPVGGNIVARILQPHRPVRVVAFEPRPVVVRGVALCEGIGRVRERDTVGAGERPEVVVERVVFLDDDHHVLDGTARAGGGMRLPFGWGGRFLRHNHF